MIDAIKLNTAGAVTETNQTRKNHAPEVEFGEVLNQVSGSKQTAKTTSLEDIFVKASEKYDVPLNLLKAVAMQESTFKTDAVSKSGAQGLMQLMPATAKELGVKDSFDPEQNVMGGAKYLSQMLKKYDGNVKLSLAAYNAGSNNVAKYGGIPPFKETQDYVVKVTKYMEQDIAIPDKTIKSTGETQQTVNNVPSYQPPAQVRTDTMEETEKETYFSYEDYTEFINLWQEQIHLFRMESNMTKIQSLFEKNEEEDKGRIF